MKIAVNEDEWVAPEQQRSARARGRGGRACGGTNVVFTIAEGVVRNSPITPTV